MLKLSRIARSLSAFAGFTQEQAWPFVTEAKNNLRPYRESHLGFYFMEPKEGSPVAKEEERNRISMAVNLSMFLQTHNIKAVLRPEEKVILFQGYNRNELGSKEKLIGILQALEPKIDHANACSLKKPSNG